MNTPARLAAYAVGLIASFGIAFGVGRAVGPVDSIPDREVPWVEVDHGTSGSTGTDGSVPTHGGGHP